MPVPEDLNILAKLLGTIGVLFDPARPQAPTLRGNLLTSNTTSAATIADTNETDLWSYTLPANSLTDNGRGVRITALVAFAATANIKTSKLYVAGTNVLTSSVLFGNPNGIDHVLWFNVIRTGSATQIGYGQHGVGTVFQAKSSLVLAGDTTAPIIIKITGQNGSVAANDVVFKGATVEFF